MADNEMATSERTESLVLGPKGIKFLDLPDVKGPYELQNQNLGVLILDYLGVTWTRALNNTTGRIQVSAIARVDYRYLGWRRANQLPTDPANRLFFWPGHNGGLLAVWDVGHFSWRCPPGNPPTETLVYQSPLFEPDWFDAMNGCQYHVDGGTWYRCGSIP
jgi:hypothetical protein